jgi:hypothetical protein
MTAEEQTPLKTERTIQLSYQQCAQHATDWEALGRNYTAVHKELNRIPALSLRRCVIFHLLDLDSIDMGIRIEVTENYPDFEVSFLPSGRYSNDYSYKMDAVPRQPFRNPERIRAWADFISVMRDK